MNPSSLFNVGMQVGLLMAGAGLVSGKVLGSSGVADFNGLLPLAFVCTLAALASRRLALVSLFSLIGLGCLYPLWSKSQEILNSLPPNAHFVHPPQLADGFYLIASGLAMLFAFSLMGLTLPKPQPSGDEPDPS